MFRPTLSTDLMDSGMEFQMTGSATEKALSPNLLPLPRMTARTPLYVVSARPIY